MQITFLGTGTSQGIPVIGCNCRTCQSNDNRDKRLRSSLLIEFNDRVLVIDSGPDFRQQMIREGVKHLSGIIFTHDHRDHIAGLDDIRPFNFIHEAAIDIFGEARVLKSVEEAFSYIFTHTDYPGIPKVTMHTIENKPFEIGGLTFLPIRVMHYKLPIFGFRINNFTYITDASYIPDEEKEKIAGAKCLVINALRRQKHIAHFSLAEALRLIKEIAPERAYITHLSHQMGLYQDLQEELPRNVQLAYDGLRLKIK